MSSRGSVCWVADRRCGLSTAWVVVSRVGAAVLVLVVAKVAVFRPFGSGVAAVVDGDVAVERRGSGLDRGGCGVCRCGMNQHGSVRRRL